MPSTSDMLSRLVGWLVGCDDSRKSSDSQASSNKPLLPSVRNVPNSLGFATCHLQLACFHRSKATSLELRFGEIQHHFDNLGVPIIRFVTNLDMCVEKCVQQNVIMKTKLPRWESKNQKSKIVNVVHPTKGRILQKYVRNISNTPLQLKYYRNILSHIAKYFIATLQLKLAEIFLKTNKYLIVLAIL